MTDDPDFLYLARRYKTMRPKKPNKPKGPTKPSRSYEIKRRYALRAAIACARKYGLWAEIASEHDRILLEEILS